MFTINIKKQLKLISVTTLILSVSLTGNTWADDTSINNAKEQQQLQTLLEWNKKAQAKFNRKMKKNLNIEIQALANMPPKNSSYASRQSYNTDRDAKLVNAVNNRPGINIHTTTPVIAIINNKEHCLINL